MRTRTTPSLLARARHGAHLCALLVGLQTASGGVVVDDPFTDGTRTNASGGDPLGLVYYRSTTSNAVPLSVVDDSGGIGTGNALLYSPNAALQKYCANFTPATLVAAGDVIRLTFDYRFTVAPPSEGGGLRFGLYFSNNTRQTSETDGCKRNDDKGYGVTMNPGLAGAFLVQKEDTNGSDDILGGAVDFSSITATNGSSVAVGTTKHTFTLDFTRLANGDVEVRGQMDGLTPSIATVPAAAVLTYTFDEFGIVTGAGLRQSYFVDNLRVALSSGGAVTLNAPAPDEVITAAATLNLSATATDPDGVARVEFYNGATKLGEAPEAPYTLSVPNPPSGTYSVIARMIDGVGMATQTPRVAIRVNSAGADEFDALREKWRTIITGGDSYNTSDPDVASRITSLTSSAQTNWNSMDKSAARTALWSDLTSTTLSAQLTSTFSRLRSMALAWGTYGSTLRNNSSLLSDIISGLDWMYANRYNETKTYYDNWWDWEIGVPQQLLDTVVLIYDALTPTQLANFMAATQKATPLGTASPVIGLTTGANRVWQAMVVALRSMLLKRPDDLTDARNAFSPVFDDVTSGDGFYADGSFIQHLKHPYTGGYGASLLGSLASGMYWLADSTWEVSDPDAANIYRWVRDSFEPLVYRGGFMDMVRGREISRSDSPDHAAGQAVIGSVLRLAEFAPTAQAAELKSLAKYWMQTDTFRSFTSTAGLPILLLGKSVLSNATVVPKPELLGHWNFSSMDRVVHRQAGWGLGLSMRSSRIYNYESINGENLKGWFTSDGATWLYNSDLGQFNDFWPTVNPYRLPGITVDTLARADSSGQSTSNTMTWVGGVTLPIGYGAAGMDFAGSGVSLTARKSWFMFDDEIVALGSGINSTDNRTIETIVENRKLSTAGTEAFTVDGVAQSTTLGWSSTLDGAHWCHLAGVAGYYFPGGASVKALREARTGSWSLINRGGSTATLTRNYVTLWFDHGNNPADASYAYALLPNKTASETATYAGAPQFQVLENSPEAQGVRETSLGVEAVNFWTDSIRTVGAITCDRKASVLTQERPGQIDLAVSDPTQTNAGTIIVEIARPAGAVLAVSPGVTVLQLSPTIRASINVNGANGRTFTATFSLLPAVSIVASLPVAAELGQLPAHSSSRGWDRFPMR